MSLPFLATAVSTVGKIETVRNFAGAASSTLSNTLFGTKGTCSQLPDDAQLAHIIRFAGPSETPMRKTRERFGRSDLSKPYHGSDKNTAIYRAPIAVVGEWLRYDCSSAGPIRQDLAKDIGTLWAKYGSTFGAVSSSSGTGTDPDFGSPPGDIDPIGYDSGGLTGGVQYDDGGFTGGIRFGDHQERMPSWAVMAIGVLIIIAIVAFATGRGGGTTGGMS